MLAPARRLLCLVLLAGCATGQGGLAVSGPEQRLAQARAECAASVTPGEGAEAFRSALEQGGLASLTRPAPPSATTTRTMTWVRLPTACVGCLGGDSFRHASYTGVPDGADNLFWHRFWEGKLRAIGRQGVHVYSRPLRYRTQDVRLTDGSVHSFRSGEEKGIDVRLALDIIRMAHRGEYDIGLVLSQDHDLSEVADEIRVVAREQNRRIKLACAFPASSTSRNRRGIDKTDCGVVDLAYRTADGWHLIDYKTDQADMAALRERYAGQLRQYGTQWSVLTDQPIGHVGLFRIRGAELSPDLRAGAEPAAREGS